MREIAILHVCPHCGRVFDSPSWCLEGLCETEKRPVIVSPQTFRRLQGEEPAP